ALPNLYIRLYNTGVASWVVQTKRLARQKKTWIGDVLVLDRVDAIKAARDLLAKIQLKLLDPNEAKRERMRANKGTFATLIPLFLEEKLRRGMRLTTHNGYKRFLTGYYFELFHNLPIDEITQDQLQTRIDEIAIDAGYEPGVVLRVFFRWATKTGKLPTGHPNPMINVETPTREARERDLTNDEIQLIWKACEAWEAEANTIRTQAPPEGKWVTTPEYPRGIMLLFLTACRVNEIGGLLWTELDLNNGELRIPGARRKARKSQEREQELCNPLSDSTLQLLHRIERRPDSNNVFGHDTRGGRGLQLSHAKKKLDARIIEAGKTPPPDWRLHDIRRTVRTR